MRSELQKAIIEHDKDMARLDRNTIRAHQPCYESQYEADESGMFVLDSVAKELLTGTPAMLRISDSRVPSDPQDPTNRNEPCPKGDKHAWIGDEAGDSWCENCQESLYD